MSGVVGEELDIKGTEKNKDAGHALRAVVPVARERVDGDRRRKKMRNSPRVDSGRLADAYAVWRRQNDRIAAAEATQVKYRGARNNVPVGRNQRHIWGGSTRPQHPVFSRVREHGSLLL